MTSISVTANALRLGEQKKHKIVTQVSDNDSTKWNLALNNAKNLQADKSADIDTEIVVYGPGIGLLKRFTPDFLKPLLTFESPFCPRIAEAMTSRVKVFACENSMRGHQLVRDDMVAGIEYLPSGVTEIMKQQGEGWAYLRP